MARSAVTRRWRRSRLGRNEVAGIRELHQLNTRGPLRRQIPRHGPTLLVSAHRRGQFADEAIRVGGHVEYSCIRAEQREPPRGIARGECVEVCTNHGHGICNRRRGSWIGHTRELHSDGLHRFARDRDHPVLHMARVVDEIPARRMKMSRMRIEIRAARELQIDHPIHVRRPSDIVQLITEIAIMICAQLRPDEIEDSRGELLAVLPLLVQHRRTERDGAEDVAHRLVARQRCFPSTRERSQAPELCSLVSQYLGGRRIERQRHGHDDPCNRTFHCPPPIHGGAL